MLPPELVAVHAAFARCAAQVDLAQRAMIRCVPSSARSLALPADVGAQTLELALAEAAAGMADWRQPAVEEHWLACTAALRATLDGLDRAVSIMKATPELEIALTAVQDLLDPLHAFVDAEQAFDRLKQRP